MDKSDVEMEDIETLNHDSGYNVQESEGKQHDGRVENKDENFSPSILVLEDANKSLNSGDEPSNLKNESRSESSVMCDIEGQINSKSEVIEPRKTEEPVGVYINTQTSSENEESISTKTEAVKQTTAGSAVEEQSHVSNELVVFNSTNGELEEEKATEEGTDSGNPVNSAVKEMTYEDVEKKHEDANPVEHATMEEQTAANADAGNNLIKVGQSPNKLSGSEVPLSHTSAANKLLADGDEEKKDLAKTSQDKEVEDELNEQSKEKEVMAAEIVTVDGGDNASFPNQEEPVTPKSIVKLLPATAGDHSGETVKPVSTLATLPLMGESDDGTPEEQAMFMKDVESFYRERSMDFKPPKFYGQCLNCLKLWRAVIRLGGYDRVTGAKLWRQVGESFHPPKTCTTVSWTFRIFYEKSLLEYEKHKKQSGELQFLVVPLPEASGVDIEGNGCQGLGSGSGRARRDSAARAMQVWHGQDIFGHGEAGEPVAKDKNINNMTKREKSLKRIGSVKQRRPNEVELSVKAARTETFKQLVTSVVDIGPPADWVKINVRQTKDCFEVYALVPGLLREEVRVQSDPAGRLVITGQPEQVDNPWGITPFKKIVSLPARIDPLQTSAVVSLHGRLFVRVPFEQSNI